MTDISSSPLPDPSAAHDLDHPGNARVSGLPSSSFHAEITVLLVPKSMAILSGVLLSPSSTFSLHDLDVERSNS